MPPPTSTQTLTRGELSVELKRQAQELFERTEIKRTQVLNLGRAHMEEMKAAITQEAQLRKARDLAVQRALKVQAERAQAEEAAKLAESQLAQLRA